MKKYTTDKANGAEGGVKRILVPPQEVFLYFSDRNRRFSCSLIGGMPGEWLLISAPAMNDDAQMLTPGTRVTITRMSQDDVYGFESRVLDRITTPVRLFFLAYPDQLENYELRRDTRVATHLPARIMGQEHTLNGIIKNLSMGGCQLTLRPPQDQAPPWLTSMAPISLITQPSGQHTPLAIQSTVRHLENKGEALTLGVSFDEDSPDRGGIIHYLETVYGLINEAGRD